MSNKICPFKDFLGRELREGDELIHPSGQYGLVVFHRDPKDPHDAWVVRYSDVDGEFESRLCLQVGDRGRAVRAIVRAAAAMGEQL